MMKVTIILKLLVFYTQATSKCIVQFLKTVIDSVTQSVSNFWQYDFKKVIYDMATLNRTNKLQ